MTSIKKLCSSIVTFAIISFFITSCSLTKKNNRDYLYFQRGLDSIETVQRKESVIKVNDVLNIQISTVSTNQEQAALFNLPNGATTNGYVVNSSGDIDIPVIGKIKAAGLTKAQLQSILMDKLTPYIKSPAVTIKFSQFNINVLGEVRAPGTKTFLTDNVTIIDAISSSGDFSDFGKKENVMVIREENGKRNYYRIDLRSGSLFQSPVYNLQPNDIVYVEANELRLQQVNTNPTRQTNVRNALSYVSIVATLTALIITLSNRL